MSDPARSSSFHSEATAITHANAKVVLSLIVAEVLGCLLLLHFLRDSRWIRSLTLCFEYLILLSSLLWLLRRSPRQNCGNLPLKWPAIMIATAFVCVCIPLAHHEYFSPRNPVDETGYSFQAQIFRLGRVLAEPLPGATQSVSQTPEELNYQNHVLSKRGWFTHFPPGWPLVLIIGQWLHTPWLLNPLFSAALLATIFLIGNGISSSSTGQLAVLVGTLSSFFLVNSVSLLSHTLSALLGAVSCWLLLKGFSTKRAGLLAGAFAVLVPAFHVRPYTALAQAAVIGWAALWYTRNDRKLFRSVLISGFCFGLLAAVTTMLYYYLCTGNAFTSPYAARVGAKLPSELTLNPRLLFWFFRKWSAKTFLDTLGGTFPFVFLLALYAVVTEREKAREVRILAAFFPILVFAYFFHTENSYSFFGSRYHFEGFFAIAVLGARGAELLAERWPIPRWLVATGLVMLAAISLSIECGAARSMMSLGQPYHAIKVAVAQLTPKPSLVFLHSGGGYNARFMNLNQADWRHARTMYLIDAEAQNRDRWACLFERRDWVVLSLDGTSGSVHELWGQSACRAASTFH